MTTNPRRNSLRSWPPIRRGCENEIQRVYVDVSTRSSLGHICYLGILSSPMQRLVAAMIWRLSHRADPRALPLADRHYNRQKIGSPQFVPPGRCMVLMTVDEKALWVTSYPYAQYVKHAWAGAWMCSMFRNEGAGLSSDLIRQAVAATRAFYGEPPELGMVTFVDKAKTKPKRDPGYCYIKAGFRPVGHTKGGLVALQLLGPEMPPAAAPIGFEERLAV